MKYCAYVLLCLIVLISACKKKVLPDAVPGNFPESWGMYGMIAGDSFRVNGTGVSMSVDTSTGKYDINIHGWPEYSQEIITLGLRGFELSSPILKITEASKPDDKYTHAFYRDNRGIDHFARSGLITVRVLVDTMLKGSFYYTTVDGIQVKGVFAVKPSVISIKQ